MAEITLSEKLKIALRLRESPDRRLQKAIESEDLPAVKAAVESGADVNAKDQTGNPMLYLAIDIEDKAIAEYLLEHGALVNIQNNWGQTPLHRAAQMEFPEHVRLLLKYGADMNIETDWFVTPFDYAIRGKNMDIAEMFVLNGYKPTENTFLQILDGTKRELYKIHLMALSARMQEHSAKLKEEGELQELAYADEIMEI